MMWTACCQCRGFRVIVEAEPDFVSICRCQFCQRRTGVPLSCNAYFMKSKVRLEGEHKIYSRDAAEGRKMHTEIGETIVVLGGGLDLSARRRYLAGQRRPGDSTWREWPRCTRLHTQDLIVDKTRFGAFVGEVTGPSSVVHHSNFQPLMTEMGQTWTFKMSAACPLPTRSRPNRRRLDTSVSGQEETHAPQQNRSRFKSLYRSGVHSSYRRWPSSGRECRSPRSTGSYYKSEQFTRLLRTFKDRPLRADSVGKVALHR